MLIINNWYGRLGNNIKQIVNALLICLIKNENYVLINNHRFFNKKKIIINNNDYNDYNDYNIMFSSPFFNKNKIYNDFQIDLLNNEIYNTNYKNIIKSKIKDLFIIKSNNKLNDNDLTIHIRSGDIFGSNPHKGWVQPPLQFYINIINSKKWTNIYLISEDLKNPCTKQLLTMYKNIIYNKNNLKTDIQIILNSTNIVYGYGTFIPSLLLLNNFCKNIYYPKYCERYLLYYLNDNVTKHIYSIKNYIKVGEWNNTFKQREWMINLDNKNIILLN
jgi:hypothetical protein